VVAGAAGVGDGLVGSGGDALGDGGPRQAVPPLQVEVEVGAVGAVEAGGVGAGRGGLEVGAVRLVGALPGGERAAVGGLVVLAAGGRLGVAAAVAGDEGEAADGDDLADGLEVRGAADAAVAGAAGGHALGLVAGDEGAAGVAGLGARRG